MNLNINNKKSYFNINPISIQLVLNQLNIRAESVVIEYKGQIYPSSQFDSITLQENDCLEIIHFIGGG